MKFPHIESKTLEFKEFLADYRRLAETVVAFANAQGGEIIIGIRDIDREVVGLSESQVLKYQEEIPPALVDQISPQLAVDTFARNIEGMVCLVVKVFPGPHRPYFASRLGYPKGIYMRYGSHNRQADDYAVRDLERARNHVSFEQMLNVGAAFDGLSPLMLDKIIHNTSAETFVAGGYGALDVDQRIKATNAGVLLFHPKPCTFIAEAYVTITRYSGATTAAIAHRETFEGTAVEQFEGAFEHLNEATGSDLYLYNGRMIPRVHDYPESAMRELLINAIVHRAYDFEAPIRVSIFSDRLEIINPGTFYAPINEHTLRDGLSRYRNPVVAQAFRKMNLMEKQGIGINSVFALCANAGLPEPQFHELEQHVKVVLYKSQVPRNMVSAPPAAAYGAESAIAGHLRIIRDTEHLTSRDFAQHIGRSQAMAKKILNALVRKGMVRMVGKARATYYVLDQGEAATGPIVTNG